MSISRSKARLGQNWLSEFNKARADNRLTDAARIYDANANSKEPIDIALLGAEVHLRSDPARAIRLLVDYELPARMKRQQARRDILLGEAYAQTQSFEAADERLADALRVAEDLDDSDLVAEAGYRLVRRHVQERSAAAARHYIEIARRGASAGARLAALRAEALVLDLEERTKDEAAVLVELLRSIDPGSPEHMNHRVWSTESLAMLARDLYVPQAIPEIERQLGGVPWPADYESNLFQTLKALGWAKAMQGDFFNAFRHLKRASALITSDCWKVVALCDRAYLARCQREVSWARQELDEAEEIADRVNWQATEGEQRAGLLLLAELFSSVDPAKSAMYLAMYRQLGEVKSPLHKKADPRRRAYALFSGGVVEIALGNKKRGLTDLREALTIFERFGYAFRAARCLVAEYDATGDKDLLARASEKLRNYGQSWLALEIRTMLQADNTSLTPMQKRVFDEACKGKTNAQIAEVVGRSEWTINNHLKQIFKAFGVNTRSALVAEAVKRGLISS